MQCSKHSKIIIVTRKSVGYYLHSYILKFFYKWFDLNIIRTKHFSVLYNSVHTQTYSICLTVFVYIKLYRIGFFSHFSFNINNRERRGGDFK